MKSDCVCNRRVQHLTASKDKEQLFISQYQMYLPIVEDLNIEYKKEINAINYSKL